MNKTQERLISFDFIRALCALGIVVFHYSCRIIDTGLFRPLYLYANGDWGGTFVCIFFLLSGAVLYHNHREIKNLKYFYYKRFKAIYPMFYIAFFTFHTWSVISTKNLFYGGNPIKFLLSLAGLDGYLSYRMVNYYQVGEWFLGAIILLYALYPLLLKLFNKSALLTTLICIGLYGLVFIPNFWLIPSGFNFFSCLITFELGIVLMRYRDKWSGNVVIFIFSTLLSAGLIFIPIRYIPENINNHILSVTMFIVLSYIGDKIMKIKAVYFVFNDISVTSFAIFLVHHKVIYKMIEIYTPKNNLESAFWLIAIIIIVYALAKLLFIINKAILNSKIYKKLENRLIYKDSNKTN